MKEGFIESPVMSLDIDVKEENNKKNLAVWESVPVFGNKLAELKKESEDLAIKTAFAMSIVSNLLAGISKEGVTDYVSNYNDCQTLPDVLNYILENRTFIIHL